MNIQLQKSPLRFAILAVCIIADIFLFLIPAFKNPYGKFSFGSFVFFLIMLSVATYYTLVKKPKGAVVAGIVAADIISDSGQ